MISGAYAELQALARLLDLPVATTVSGQGAIAETDPHAVGVVGSNGGNPATRAVVDEADVVLFIGCRAGSVTTERWRSPPPGKTIIHIDSDPMVIGANYPTEVAICADARLALAALVAELEERRHLRKPERRGARRRGLECQAGRLRAARVEHANGRSARSASYAALSQPARRRRHHRRRSGHALPLFLRPLSLAQSRTAISSPTARTARSAMRSRPRWARMSAGPDVKTVAVMGDGSFGFCCGEFETIARHRMPITSIVFSNATFGWIKAGQNSGFGQRFYNVDFNRTDHAAVAAAFGVKSWRVEDPEELESVLKQALAHDGPTLVDVISQPLHEAAAPVSEWVA